MVDYKRCSAITGFNTKQVWVYDGEHDAYIDPPAEVLKKINNEVEYWWDFDQKERIMEDIIKTNPAWLQDTRYTYADKDFEI